MSLTQIIGKVFVPRQRALEKHLNGGEALQRAVLEHLIHAAKDTEYGRNHAFAAIKSVVKVCRKSIMRGAATLWLFI